MIPVKAALDYRCFFGAPGRVDFAASELGEIPHHGIMSDRAPAPARQRPMLNVARRTSPEGAANHWLQLGETTALAQCPAVLHSAEQCVIGALHGIAAAGRRGMDLSGVNPVSGLTAWLRDKQALIVLDSCEHVVSAAAKLAEGILRAAPRTHILATSREPLRAEGEWLHRLVSLEVPPDTTDVTTGDALHYPAVELFNERANAIVDGITLSAADLQAVIEICRRLDGAPLALELAAAQVDVLGIRGLAARLDDRFAVLTRGRRTALPRHQTLRAAMDWSYDLLPEIDGSVGPLMSCAACIASELNAAVASRTNVT